MRDQLIMDIAMNLTRVGNWAADDFIGKQKRIIQFLKQTDGYIHQLSTLDFPNPIKKTLHSFLVVYPSLVKEAEFSPTDVQKWAETMMTWGNILTHRANIELK